VPFPWAQKAQDHQLVLVVVVVVVVVLLFVVVMVVVVVGDGGCAGDGCGGDIFVTYF
jgi:hypothetical protein